MTNLPWTRDQVTVAAVTVVQMVNSDVHSLPYLAFSLGNLGLWRSLERDQLTVAAFLVIQRC